MFKNKGLCEKVSSILIAVGLVFYLRNRKFNSYKLWGPIILNMNSKPIFFTLTIQEFEVLRKQPYNTSTLFYGQID